MTRIDADAAMAAYDDAVTAYRYACRIGHGQDEAFERWNDAREALIDRLCAEAKEAA